MSSIMKLTRERKNFNGLNFIANYWEAPPYSYERKGKILGILTDCIRVVANELNLTLVLKPPLPKNEWIWAKGNYSKHRGKKA